MSIFAGSSPSASHFAFCSALSSFSTVPVTAATFRPQVSSSDSMPSGLPSAMTAAVAAVRCVTKLISCARSSVAYMPEEMRSRRPDLIEGMRPSKLCGL